MNALTWAIDADGRPGMSSWPEILSKYNNLLAQSHTLMNALSGAHIPQPARKLGEAARERVNPFETIALHPLISTTANPSSTVASAAASTSAAGTGGVGVIDEAAHGMIENLLRTDPHPEVIKRWDETVRRFVERRKGGTRMTNEDIIKEMNTMKEDHDSRIRRAVEVVEGLKDKWDWKLRVALDDPNAEEGDEDEDEDLFGDKDEDDEVIDVDKLIKDEDEVMATQTTSQTMRNGSMMMETSQNSQHPPPTTQQTVIEEENMFSDNEEDDDDEFEDVMED
jgi:hypothetical protein